MPKCETKMTSKDIKHHTHIQFADPVYVKSEEEFRNKCIGYSDFPEDQEVIRVFGSWETDGFSVTNFSKSDDPYIAVIKYWYMNREIIVHFVIYNPM